MSVCLSVLLSVCRLWHIECLTDITDLFSLFESGPFKMHHVSTEHVISRLSHVYITWGQRGYCETQATLLHELPTVHLIICHTEQMKWLLLHSSSFYKVAIVKQHITEDRDFLNTLSSPLPWYQIFAFFFFISIEKDFNFHVNQTHFRVKGLAPDLILKQMQLGNGLSEPLSLFWTNEHAKQS